MDTRHLAVAILFAGTVSAAPARDGASPPSATCVDLGPDRSVVRHGDTSSFTLRNGETYYLVTLRGTCNSMRSARTVSIRTRGVDGRICPKGSTVQTRYDICSVKSIEELAASRGSAGEDHASR